MGYLELSAETGLTGIFYPTEMIEELEKSVETSTQRTILSWERQEFQRFQEHARLNHQEPKTEKREKRGYTPQLKSRRS